MPAGRPSDSWALEPVCPTWEQWECGWDAGGLRLLLSPGHLTKAGKVAAGAFDKEQYPWARAPRAVSRIPLLFCFFNKKEQKWLRKRILFLNF